MTGSEIRQRFLEHFASREHRVLPSYPLVLPGDTTTLFTIAGMQPLKSYFQGLSDPPAPRLVSSQKCFRTGDLEEIGRTDRHNTFMEMLGNFAPTGAYFKETAIPIAWELVVEGFQLPVERIRVTIHPSDDEAHEIWARETDIRHDWIYRNQENWWAPGDTGPCGPDSELWWDRGPEYGCGQEDCHPDHCERFLEFWNLVFMQFDRQPDGSLPGLPSPGIDTGMGLERITSIIQGVDSNFDTDLFTPIFDFIHESGGAGTKVSERVVADHLRAMTMLIGDGVLPSTEGRGYVLRRVIRRALLHARRLGMRAPLQEGVRVVARVMGDAYPELEQRRQVIAEVIGDEAERFSRTLDQGMDLFERIAAAATARVIPGEDAFRLHDTFGFPLELTRELAAERSLQLDIEGFEAAMTAQRQRSRSMTGQRWLEASKLPRSEFIGYRHLAGEGRILAIHRSGAPVDSVSEGDAVEVFLDRTPFYAESGGQVGDTGLIAGPEGQIRVEDTQKPGDGVVAHIGTVTMGVVRVEDPVVSTVDAARRQRIARHHSATHLVHRALMETLGQTQGLQRGSWVGPDHTTFDFVSGRGLSPEQLEAVGRRVNEQVRAGLPFHETIQTYAEAVSGGAVHLFDEKYGDRVRVVCFGDWTCEFCGGTHVTSTAHVGTVVIVSEASIGSGLRRIDLVAGEAAEDLIRRRLSDLSDLGRELGVPPEQVGRRVTELRAQLKAAERRVERLQDDLRSAQVQGGAGGVQRLEARIPLVAQIVEAESTDDLRAYADRYLEVVGGSGVVALVSGDSYVIKVSRDLTGEYDANRLKAAFGGRGGGRPELVQGRLSVDATTAFASLQEMLK